MSTSQRMPRIEKEEEHQKPGESMNGSSPEASRTDTLDFGLKTSIMERIISVVSSPLVCGEIRGSPRKLT